MGRIGRVVCVCAVVAAGMLLLAPACTREHKPAARAPGTPTVRVRLLTQQQVLTLRATAAPTVKTTTERRAVRLNLPPSADVALVLDNGVWKVGGVQIPGDGELTMWQAEDASLSVSGRSYRGHFRFVPIDAKSFDVINDVDIDGYLKGVVSRELLRGWNEDAYRAQAIVARTYALYEARTQGRRRHFDLFADQRSQVYGGYDDESSKSQSAVDETSGVVLAYGKPGQERIFKTYFSACCGGVTQSSADAFGEQYIVPLSDQNVQALCNPAPKFNWGPVELTKSDLTRRLRAYRGEKSHMGPITRLDIQFVNRFNRPILFVATDNAGERYTFNGEELRYAINAGATKNSPAKLYSSFVKIVNDPNSDVVRFVEGHGHGHGVGMCQWCSEIRAEAGMRHEDILISAYPRAKLVRAY